MRLRIIVGSGMLMLLGITAVITTVPRAQSNQESRQGERIEVPVTANQLSAEKNIIPVELRCKSTQLLKGDTIEKIPCVVVNNTNKYITAATINSSIIVEVEGKTSGDSDFLSLDPLAHPDFRAERKDYLIAPGGEIPVPFLATSYDSGVIKGVLVQVDYVEFADKTMLGPNLAGSRIIADVRDGAAKYKNWLAEKYHRSGKSMSAITPLLEKGQPLPEEIESLSNHQQEGAIIYRNYARKTFETKGAEGLVKHLTHKDDRRFDE
ncbi:MAG TPA: hypothetical protein VK388_13520 [Pyrinomonadaceae bacterium]|nr:hypothetical protein [Pyrinomonadaceae bacterium]